MPHDKNGTVIEPGDGVKFTGWDGKVQVGIVARVAPAAATCNVTLAVPVMGGCDQPTINADMCEVLTRGGLAVMPPFSVVLDEAHVHAGTEVVEALQVGPTD